MLAVDTNLIVRYLTGDHPKQSLRARALIDGEPVFVGVTVVLEVEWVLRSTYEYRPADVARGAACLRRSSHRDDRGRRSHCHRPRSRREGNGFRGRTTP